MRQEDLSFQTILAYTRAYTVCLSVWDAGVLA